MTRRRLLRTAALASAAAMTVRPARAALPVSDAFGTETTAEQATAGLDLAGKTVLVTGCTSGIGLEMTRVLALRGAHVIGTSRTQAKGEAAREGLPGRISIVPLDLADLKSVAECAARVGALVPHLDALVCNAGIVLGEWQQVRALEKQFAVNHLGHFALVQRLIDRVVDAPQGRVVVLGSGDHANAPAGGIQFDALSGKGWFERGYAHSKLANGLFSLELARRLHGTRATCNCVTPGHTRTDILRNVGDRYGAHARDVQHGAATPCYAAVHPAMAGATGQYLRDFHPAEQSDLQQDTEMALRLWNLSILLAAG